MKQKKITQNKLTDILGVGVTTLYCYFKKCNKTPTAIMVQRHLNLAHFSPYGNHVIEKMNVKISRVYLEN